MIKFVCILCGERIGVQDRYAGKRITCPKCNRTSVVPNESPRIKFVCQSCGQRIRVLQIHAGKEAKCPKCKSRMVVPSLRADPETGSETVTVVCSMCGETIAVPKDAKDRFIECPSCSSNVESSLGGKPVDSYSIPPSKAEGEYEDETDVYEEDDGPDRRVILAICAAALVIVVGVITLVVVISPSDSSPAGRPGVSTRQEESAVADLSPQSAVTDRRPEGTFTLEPPVQEVAPAEPSASPTNVDNGAPGFDLKLRLGEGQKRKLRITSDDRVALKLMGQSQDIHGVSTTDLEFSIERVDANGVASIKITYLAIREKGGSAAGTMEYDSTKPDVGADNPLAPSYSSMIGKSFIMRVRPDGRMLKLSGIDRMHLRMAQTIVENEDKSIRDRMKERYGELSEERAQRAIGRLDQQYGSRSERQQAVKEMIEANPLLSKAKIEGLVGNVIVSFPSGPVEVGDSWKAEAVLPAAAPVDIELTYTLKEKSQNVAAIAIDSKIDLVNEPAPGPVGPMGPTTVSLTGSYTGNVQIDPNTGWMLYKKATMQCSGRMEMTNREKLTQSTPISMESVTIVELIE
jgi:DNA-directed RNA polymerase subunit RPC12/RpoP